MEAQTPEHKYGPAGTDVSPEAVLHHVATYRLRLLKNSQISLVQLCKLSHVGDKNIDLDDFIQTGSGLFKNGFQVLQDLRLSSRNRRSQTSIFVCPARVYG